MGDIRGVRGVFVLILIILILSILTTLSFAENPQILLDPQIQEDLNTQNTVKVIITLNNPEELKSTSIQLLDYNDVVEDKLEQRKQIIDQQQVNLIQELEKPNFFGIKDHFEIIDEYNYINSIYAEVDEDTLEKLKSSPQVKSISTNQIVQLFLDTSIPLINASLIYDNKINGTNITGLGETICVLDSGINYTLPHLGNCSSTNFTGGDCAKVPGGYDYVNSDNDPYDDSTVSHGTFVSGIIASTNPTYQGVAFDSRIYSMKVCNSTGSCFTNSIQKALDSCIGNKTLYNISVASLSLGTLATYNSDCDTDDTSGLASTINDAVDSGLIAVVASGNAGNSAGISSPACASKSISVGSTTKSDTVSSFSNSASILTLLAPGEDIISSKIPNTFASASGTSYAAPMVSGAIALMMQGKRLLYNTTFNRTQLINAFNLSGVKITDSRNSFVFPRINVNGAFNELFGSNITFISPNPLNNTVTTDLSFVVNISTDYNLSSATLDIGGSNISMNGSNRNWHYNYSGSGKLVYRIHTINILGADSTSQERVITLNNTAPVLVSPSPILINYNFTEPSNQTFSIYINDSEKNNLSVKWYLDGTLVSANFANNTFSNYTYVGNLSSDGNHTLNITVSDSSLISYEVWNFTVLNANRDPILNAQSNITINETLVLNFNSSGQFNASDLDPDTLTYNVTGDLNVSQSSFAYLTKYSDVGIYEFNISVKDGRGGSDSQIIIVEIVNIDTDNDGNPDWNDTDDDNDGILDTSDFLTGNKTDIFVRNITNFDIKVNGSSNLSKAYNKSQSVKFMEGSSVIIEFNHTFASRLNLANMSIRKKSTGSGGMIIRGIKGINKSFYITNLTSANGVCIKNAELNFFSEISSDCTGTSETFIGCPGGLNGFSCAKNGTNLKISGLTNSGVVQQSGTVSSDDSPPSSSSPSTSDSSTSSTPTTVINTTTTTVQDEETVESKDEVSKEESDEETKSLEENVDLQAEINSTAINETGDSSFLGAAFADLLGNKNTKWFALMLAILISLIVLSYYHMRRNNDIFKNTKMEGRRVKKVSKPIKNEDILADLNKRTKIAGQDYTVVYGDSLFDKMVKWFKKEK